MKKYYIVLPVILFALILAFYSGKYYCWEQNPDRYQTSSTKTKDWQWAAIYAFIVLIGIMGIVKYNNAKGLEAFK